MEMMDLEEQLTEEEVIGLAVICRNLVVLKQRKRARRCWERPHLGIKKRKIYGQQNMLDQMRISDVESFISIVRLCPESFDKLLSLVGPHIRKFSSREPINPSTRLAVTLRYLATGESKKSLAYNYRIGASTCFCIIWETLGAIYNSLKPIVLPEMTIDRWLQVADGFNKRWNVPNCVGAADGKHVRTKRPARSGSEFHNYKSFFSTIMMGICDAYFRFLAVDTGCQGRNNDVIVLNESEIGQRLMNGTLGSTGERAIENGPVLPHFLLADGIFGIKPNLMVPYPGRGTGKLSYIEKIFNYRQARGRRVIEMSFGIFAAVWEIFRTEINATPDMVDRIVLAAVCLHNFKLEENENNENFMENFVMESIDEVMFVNSGEDDGEHFLRNERADARVLGDDENFFGNTRADAELVRKQLAEYFVDGGRLDWQDRMIY